METAPDRAQPNNNSRRGASAPPPRRPGCAAAAGAAGGKGRSSARRPESRPARAPPLPAGAPPSAEPAAPRPRPVHPEPGEAGAGRSGKFERATAAAGRRWGRGGKWKVRFRRRYAHGRRVFPLCGGGAGHVWEGGRRVRCRAPPWAYEKVFENAGATRRWVEGRWYCCVWGPSFERENGFTCKLQTVSQTK